MSYDTLKNTITEAIRPNGNQEITGQILQDVLLDIVDEVGEATTQLAERVAEKDGTYPQMSVGFAQNALVEQSINLSNAQVGIYRADKSSLTFLSLSGYLSLLINVEKGEKYEYASVLGGDSMASIIYYDNADKILSYENRGSAETRNTKVTGSITIPEGAVKMSFTTQSTTGYYLFKYVGTSLEEVIQDIEDIKADCQDFKDEFLVSGAVNLWDGATIEGVINTSGGISIISSWASNISTGLIPIQPNTFYYISGRANALSSTAIRCLAADGTTPMKVLAAATGQVADDSVAYRLPNVDGTDSVKNGLFKTPTTAAYVQFVLSTGTPEQTPYDEVMIQYAGAEYDASFIPLPYEPYSDVKVINPQKIPYIPNEEAENALNRKYPLNVLLIGSSHGMNSISQFPWIAYKSGFDVTVGNLYKGSLTLQQVATAINGNTSIGGSFKIWEKESWATQSTTKFNEIVASRKWDYIILQRSASDDSVWTSEQADALDVIITAILNSATSTPKILFNSGFPDPTASVDGQRTQWESIMESARNMQATYQIGIIPMATAIVNARTTSLGNIGYYTNKQLCYDSQHLDYGIGCYVCGVTLFEYILKDFGWSCLTAKGYATYEEAASFGVTVDYDGITSSAYTEPTAQTMTIAKYCAMAAVREPDVISSKLSEKYPL